MFNIPESAFTFDIKKCVKGSTNKITRQKRERAFYMMSAFWVLLNSDYIAFPKDDNGIWLSFSVAEALGKDFIDLFDKLSEYNNKRYKKSYKMQYIQIKDKLKLIKKHYYKINSCSGEIGNKLKCVAITEDDPRYEKIKVRLDRVKASMDKASRFDKRNLRENETKIADRYRDMHIDEEKAVGILEAKYGLSLQEAMQYKNMEKDTENKAVLLKCHKAKLFNQQYSIIKNFNAGTYRVTAKYGRLFTGFHSLLKEVRSCLRNKSGEKMVELYDMHGAHTVGWLTMCSCFEDTKNYLDYALSESDPYRFAVKGAFENNRPVAKTSVMTYVFAGKNDCSYRGTYIARMKEENNYDEMLKFCMDFKNIVDSYDITSLKSSTLNAIFSQINFSPDIWYVLTKRKYDRLSFYNGHSYKSLDSKSAYRDMDNGRIDVKALMVAVDVAYKAMLQYHVECCLKDTFGSKIIKTCTNIKQYFKNKSDKIVDMIAKYCDSKKSRRENAKGNTPNASVMCQIAEGWTLIDNIVPELVKELNCKDIVTLHDAILVPESVAKKVNVRDLNTKVVAMFIANVEYVFKHIDKYFSGKIDAPFSYLG